MLEDDLYNNLLDGNLIDEQLSSGDLIDDEFNGEQNINQGSEITNALAGEIYNRLKETDSGEMPYQNSRILFQAGFRDDNNLPRDASVEVIDEEGDGFRVYNLIFE